MTEAASNSLPFGTSKPPHGAVPPAPAAPSLFGTSATPHGVISSTPRSSIPIPVPISAPTSFPLTEEQTSIRDGFRRGEDMVIAAGAGTGKALRDDQRVQTPNGPVPIGSLSVGDEVIGSNGFPTRVTGVYPQGVRPLFEVVTCDGVSIIADEDHRWTVTAETRDGKPSRNRVATTVEVSKMLEQDVTVLLPVMSAPAVTYVGAGVSASDAWSREKYLGLVNAPVEQRVDTLQECMSGSVVGDVVAVDSELAEEFADVVRSLGGTAEVRLGRDDGVTPVRVQCPALFEGHTPERRIISVSPVTDGSATCISVEADDKLFATEGFVLTHNTSTITMLADDLYAADKTATGVYLAFNKSIADEVGGKLFYRNVQAMTTHSLANRALRVNPNTAPLMDKLGRRVSDEEHRVYRAHELPKAFGVSAFKVLQDDTKPMHPSTNPILLQVQPQTLCKEAVETIKEWCKSAEDVIDERHVRLETKLTGNLKDRFVEKIVELARRMWSDDIMSSDGRLHFLHDHYLKIYSLMDPDIHAQMGFGNRRAVLFFDEAQDSRPCVTRIIMAQQGKMQLVMCGDSSQSIYRFLGCRDALAKFRKYQGVSTYTLSKTFRFGEQIASVANQILAQIAGSDLRIIPDLSIPSRTATCSDGQAVVVDVHGAYPDAVICRTNLDLIETALHYLAQGTKVFCMTDTDKILEVAEDFIRLSNGERPKNSDMRGFASMAKLQEFLNKRRGGDAVKDAAVSADDEDEVVIEDTLTPILFAIEKFGPRRVIDAVSRIEPSERTAQVVVSTIHKAKGRQWDSVHVRWDGFATSNKTDSRAKDDLMLLYVAVTRAKKALVIPQSVSEIMVCPEGVPSANDAPGGYVRAMHPLAHPSIASDMHANGIKPHVLMSVVVFIANELLPEADREYRAQLTVDVLAEIGIENILEMMELVDSGMPVALISLSYACNGVTGNRDVEAVLNLASSRV